MTFELFGLFKMRRTVGAGYFIPQFQTPLLGSEDIQDRLNFLQIVLWCPPVKPLV